MALEQEHQQQQQQQQQQQGWNNEMSQAGKEEGASLGVYTPDSSTNSVHSLHGYPESHENMAEQASYSQELAQPLDTSYTTVPDTNTEPVHNTSVMESPSSIASVEMSGQYGEVHPRPVHTVNSSPGISNSPSHPPTSNQSPSAGIHNMTSHSPHHAQNTPISQSPHPIQSPHPPMQPSPHQSPHPPYTNLPHQSPTGSGYATPAPPPGRQPSSSSKSPGRGSRSGLSSSQQTQHLVRQQLTHQYQYDQYAQALAAQGLLGKQHRGHEAAAYSMFPPTTMASFMSPYYSSQPGHGHSSQSTSHLSRLHQLTQTLDIQGQPVPQSHVPHPSPPPQKPSKSSKSRGSVAPASHLGLPPGYPHMAPQYPSQQVAQVGRVPSTSGGNQARPPNVTIPLHHGAYTMQAYNQAYQTAMLTNPALMYGQNYDNRTSGMYPAGYGTPYYHR